MVKLHLVVGYVFETLLTDVIIAADHFEHDPSRNSTSSCAVLLSFRRAALNEENRARMAKNLAADFLRVVLTNLLCRPRHVIFQSRNGIPYIFFRLELSRGEFVKDLLVVGPDLLRCPHRSWSGKHLDQLAVRTILQFPAGLADGLRREFLLS